MLTDPHPEPLKLFYCYAHADAGQRNELQKHLTSLEHDEVIRGWHDEMIIPGEKWCEEIERNLEQADIILLLVSSNFLASEFINDVELKKAMARHNAGTACVIPVIIKPCDWKGSSFGSLQALPKEGKPVITWRFRNEAWLDVVAGIRRAAKNLIANRCAASGGVVGAERFRASRRRFAGEVYAIELLEQPVHMKRSDKGQMVITVDRKGVQEYIISNEGKRAKFAEYITPENRARILTRDAEIHAFLAGSGPGEMKFDGVHEFGLRLRWASGGVLSIIECAGKRWVPFFFRDIGPVGWNIALGSAERAFDKRDIQLPNFLLDRELNEPAHYILREFIEETMILDGDPARVPRSKLIRRRLTDPRGGRAETDAWEFDEEHHWLRRERDEIDIEFDDDRINLVPVKTQCELAVCNDGRQQSRTPDVLVAFSLPDLGIEVVQVKEYTIKESDYLLDGETQPGNELGVRHLVRMPIALLSMDYLRKTFGPGANWQHLTGDQPPSIQVATPPKEKDGEIRLFPFDIERRTHLLNSSLATTWEHERFTAWMRDFGHHFLNQDGRPSAANPPTLFVPATAKILNLYFSSGSRGS